ncbi:MAG: SGNH/GDSL hydrolase family protein [Methylococcales bacterium]
MKAKALKIIGVNILVFLGLVLLIEATGQMIAVIRPSYDVLFLQPDEGLGWKQVPNLHWTWTGFFWYAADFSVEVETNPLGFRDLAREFSKPQGVTRVALLGDSFIEAVQVPLTKTATQLLERRLNTSLGRDPEHPQRWEVLNFGISNYGVGQYLLTWEQYASRYHPDYVAIFVARLHMKRTINKYEYGAFTATAKEKLWIRPTFRIENGSLIREPAKDFNKFVEAQEDLTKAEFAGKKIRRKRMQLLTLYYARRIRDDLGRLFRRFYQTSDQITTSPRIDPDADGALFAVNLKIIEDLGRKVHSAGSRLVVLDASQYFGDNEIVSRTLNEFCAKYGFGYIPLYKDLFKANMSGISPRWSYDGHFNDT